MDSRTVQQCRGNIISNPFHFFFLTFLKCSLTIAKVILLWYKKHIGEDTRVELDQQIHRDTRYQHFLE